MDAHKQAMRHSSKECNHRTPPALFAKLEQACGRFEIDLAARWDDCLVHEAETGNPIYYGPDHPHAEFQNALRNPWMEHATLGFLNPPYSLTLYSQGRKAGIPAEDLAYLRIEKWAKKAYLESLAGFTTIGVFPYAPQTDWFREYVMGHAVTLGKANGTPYALVEWSGHAALDFWRLPHRVSFLTPDGEGQNNANVNTCIVHWGPNPGFVGPWVPSGRYWSYR